MHHFWLVDQLCGGGLIMAVRPDKKNQNCT